MLSSKGPGARVKLSKVNEDEILAEFDSYLVESVASCQQVHERAVKAHKHYTAFVKKDPGSIYATDSYDPQFFGSVYGAVASEFGVITSSPYILGYEPRSEQGDLVSDFYDAAFDYHWKEDPKRFRKLQDILTQRRLYGTVYGCARWNEEWSTEAVLEEELETVEVPMTNPFDGLGSVVSMQVPTKKWKAKRVKKKDSPWFEVFNFFSCYPDTKQEYVADGRFFIHRSRRTKAYVKEQGLKGEWYRPVVKALLEQGGQHSSNYGSYSSIEYIEALNATVGFSQDEPMSNPEDIFEEFEMWTQDYYAVIVNRRVVCYRKGHILGRLPLFHVRNYLVPGEHFGMSDYQVVEKSIADLQNMHNTMLSNAYVNAFPPLVVGGPTVDLKEFRLAWRPGGILRMPGGDVNGNLRQLPVASDSIEMARSIKGSLGQTIDNALASSDTTRGTLPTRTTSATAVVQATASLTSRQGMQASMFECEFIQWIGEAYRDLINKLQSDEVSVKLRNGKEWVKFRPQLGAYDQDLDCVPVAGSSKLSELEQKRLIELLNLAANFRIQNVNLQEGFKVIVESMAPRLAGRLMMDQDEYMKMMQTQAMLQRLQEGPEEPDSDEAPGAMAVSNQIGNSQQDLETDEMSQEYGEGNTL